MKAKNIDTVIEFIKNNDGESTIIKTIIYNILFQYFDKFEIKPFIPVHIVNNEDIKNKTIKAFIFSKLYYLHFKTYLPIIFIITLSIKCQHSINIICLPSQKVVHQFNIVIIDTSELTKTNEICLQEYSIILNSIQDEFKKFSMLFKTNSTLMKKKDSCVLNFQGNYGTCVYYSLGITLNYLFQKNKLSIFDMCRIIFKKKDDLSEHFIITIGRISHLFHKFIRKTMFKKYRQIEYQKNKAESIYNAKEDNIQEIYDDDKELGIRDDEGNILDSKLKISIEEAKELRSRINEKVFNDKIEKLNKLGQLDVIIIDMFIKEKNHDKPTLKIISRFLKKCKQAIEQWTIKNINNVNIHWR